MCIEVLECERAGERFSERRLIGTLNKATRFQVTSASAVRMVAAACSPTSTTSPPTPPFPGTPNHTAAVAVARNTTASMRFYTVVASAILATSASARSSIFGSSQQLAPADEDLSVPGESPLFFCADPKDNLLVLESVDLDPNPPLP